MARKRITLTEAADILGVSRKTARRWFAGATSRHFVHGRWQQTVSVAALKRRLLRVAVDEESSDPEVRKLQQELAATRRVQAHMARLLGEVCRKAGIDVGSL